MPCEFLISGLTILDADRCAIDGRVLNQPFNRNQVFRLCSYRPWRMKNDQFVEDPERKLPDRDVRIEISQIEAYESCLEQAQTGLVYRLITPLRDTELLGVGWILTD